MTKDREIKKLKENKKKRPLWNRILRTMAKIALFLFIFFTLLVLFIRSPWGQQLIVGEVTAFVSNKTKTKVEIKKLFITFGGAVELQGLYLEDKAQDTLIYSEQLLANIPIWPIIRGNPIAIDGLKWNGLRAHVVRKDSIEGFNYQFLIDAFASDSTSTETEPSEPPKISVGSIHFTDFKVHYNDAVSGMNVALDLGDLYLKGKQLDLEKMKFQVAKIAVENTTVTYLQTKLSAPSEPSEAALPYLSLDQLELKNVHLNYQSVPDSLIADLDLAELTLQVPKADLSQQDIEVGEFTLLNSNLKLQLNTVKQQPIEGVDSTASKEPFSWPDWNVKVAAIALQNNHIHYQTGRKLTNKEGFNADYIVVHDFNFKATDLALSKNNAAKLNLETISYQEESGLTLNQLGFNAALTPTELAIEKLVLKTGNSSLKTDLKVEFTSLQQLIDKPEESPISIDLKQFIVDVKDAYKLNPELQKNEYVAQLAKHQLTGKIKANGTLSALTISDILVNWGQSTTIKTQGELKNLLDFENFVADINQFNFTSTRSDISNFVSEKELGITLPKTVTIRSQLSGKLDDFKTKLQLTIPEGKINIDAQLKQQQEIAFDALISVQDFNLGKIINNPNLGLLAFELTATGKGKSINDLNAKLSSQFTKLEVNQYDFSALQLDGELNKGKGAVTLTYKDENLDLLVNSKLELDSVSPKIELDLNLEGADLYALGFSEKQMKTKLIVQANFDGNAESFNFSTHFSEGVVVHDKENYYLGPVDLVACVRKDSTSLDISSNFLNGELRSNADPVRISKAIEHQLRSYFADSVQQPDTINRSVELLFNLKLSETKLLTALLVPGINAIDTLDFSLNFNQKEKKLTANITLPYLDYADKTIDSLQFQLNSLADNAMFKVGFNHLDASPILMNRTYFDGNFKNGLLNLHFHAFDEEKETYVIKTEVSGKSSNLKIHVNPEKLIFEGKAWSIPQDNELTLQKDKITATNFVFSQDNQRIEFANNLEQLNQENIGIGFENFKLANILGLFNKDNLLASGNLNGSIIALNPFGNLGLKAAIDIDDLTALQTDLGKLSLTATTKDDNSYHVDLGIKGTDVDLALKGDYSPENLSSALDFKLDLTTIGMKTIAALSGESLKDATGSISGELALKGTTSNPDYDGFIKFNDANFNVSQLNSNFLLANDKIKINTKGIELNQFSIQDEQKNTLTLNGTILTENFADPKFDLTVKAKNFLALNSKKEDNELFYGTFNFDIDGAIHGFMSAPKVTTAIGINKNTDFTYVLLNAQAELEKSDGIVEFVNKKNPDAILTRTDDTLSVALFEGIELRAKITIDKEATFNVIIDPKTGDNLAISGVGALDFSSEQNGRTTLSGSYEIEKGHYNLSLYNLVKREFKLEPGSSIVWRGGGPMDADLNVTANYSVEASASALMASQTAGSSEEVKNKYRQKLPFLVYLNVKGGVDEPELSFNLGMPEDARGAIDGTVYSRIKQINTEEDALNKQVFSLLVLRKFYPNSGSDGSDGGAASLVRKNLNDALSDQLNLFSDKLTGNTGIELDFGLNSYTDYQGESTQQRTDLNISAQKKLLDDRLIVQVGSNVSIEGDANPGEENPVVGNVSIQYLLTKDGRWRLKGFRNSQYENVIDGQVFVNGIALNFQRQFNKFNELFAEPIKETEEEKEPEEPKEEKEKKEKTDKKNEK